MSRQNRYPASLMVEVCELHGAGWTAYQIHRILRERGQDPLPTMTTVYLWTNPDYRASHQRSHRRAASQRGAAAAKFRLPSRSEAYQAAFVRRLRDEGVTWVNVARVCRVVFGGRWDERRVQRLIEEETAA